MVEQRALPLFSWAEAHHGTRPTLGPAPWPGRALLAAAASIGVLAVLVPPQRPRLVWNASASAPVGLYRVAAGAPVRRGAMVIAWMPPEARQLATRRRYVPAGVPLVKQAAAVAGDTVCAIGPVVSINGRRIAERRRRDALGRRLPWWEGCVTLKSDEVFLLMTARPDSFDGRYFGPSHARDILGEAHPLCVR